MPLMLLSTIVTISSCYKEEPCEAVITVVYEDDTLKPVGKAVVFIRMNEDKNGFIDSGMTSNTGVFLYERRLPAIPKCDVLLDTNSTVDYKINQVHYFGTDYLHLKQGETTNLKIKIKRADSASIPDKYKHLVK